MGIRELRKRFGNKFRRTIQELADLLSFNGEVESLVDLLNHKLESPIGQDDQYKSHPGGYAKGLRKRRISMAGHYIRIIKYQAPEEYQKRLNALKNMVDESFHAKTTDLPLNTARVQVALIKEMIKAQGFRRRQLEAMTDFGKASFGQPPVIRSYLNKLHIVEAPEKDLPLKQLALGWDDHVHDMYSEGRKTPTQLLLDAFVKGISEITVVYSGIDARDCITETIEAGKILGIRVHIGLEFSVGKGGERRHYMFIPPYFEDAQDLFNYFENYHEVLDSFWINLRRNKDHRRYIAQKIIDRFNETKLSKLNADYAPASPYILEPLTMQELESTVGHSEISRYHIGELLYQKMKKAMFPRVLHLRAQAHIARKKFRGGKYSEWELKNLVTKYESIRRRYEELSPEYLYERHLDDKDVVDYDSAFEREKDILPKLAMLGGRVVMLHPFSLPLSRAINYLLENYTYLTDIELFNSKDSSKRSPNDLLVFNKFLYILNNENEESLINFLGNQNVKLNYGIDLPKIFNDLRDRKIIPICGSDSTGRDPTIPGMGFIRASKVSRHIMRKFSKEHYKMPRPLANMILNRGVVKNASDKTDDILFLGKIGRSYVNKIGDENTIILPSLRNFITYLNPNVKNIVMIAIGFTVAYKWIGLHFAMIWFGITFFRNVLVDLIAASGLDFGAWSSRKINFENASHSLFWTGFSVPILNTVKAKFDLLWPLSPVGIVFEASKFFFICLANGTYIATHNTIRNFDSKTRRVNFFRTIIAWPFATVFSPIGNLLAIPSIVQAKIWSDIVGGMIEGTGKFWQRYNLRIRDLNEILPNLCVAQRTERLVALLDILYIWSDQARGKTCLKKLLIERPDYHVQLLSILSDPSCVDDMCEYILSKYHDKEALQLIDLVGKNYEYFFKWIKDQKKQN